MGWDESATCHWVSRWRNGKMLDKLVLVLVLVLECALCKSTRKETSS